VQVSVYYIVAELGTKCRVTEQISSMIQMNCSVSCTIDPIIKMLLLDHKVL